MALEFQCGLVHEPISVRDSIEILDATAATVKEWNKLKHLLAWDFTRVRPNADAVFDARDKHRSVHSASLMQLCHLKLAELAKTLPQVQRAWGTGQRRLTISRLCGMAGEALSAQTSKHEGRPLTLTIIRERMYTSSDKTASKSPTTRMGH